jgi:phosphosulfolactate synthase (CoM biosynthesis protein A)
MDEKAFRFMDTIDIPEKPRDTHVIEMRGPYYNMLTRGGTEDILADWGDYVDGYKFSGGAFRMLDRDALEELIQICHDHDVWVDTGGAVERYVVEGPEMVEKYIQECKAVGFDVVEVSDSNIAAGSPHLDRGLTLDELVAIVQDIQDAGLKAKPEISFMYGAGFGVHDASWEDQLRDTDDVIEKASRYLDAGADMLMVESEGLTELPGDTGSEDWRLEPIQRLLDEFGREQLMFEAAEPAVFKWYLRNVGRDVNLFVDHNQVVEFNAFRLKLWGDTQLWDGEHLEYPTE